VSHLRIVKPEGDKPPRRKGQRPAPVLTAEQQAKARAALKNLRSAYGGWDVLAQVMGVSLAAVKAVAAGSYTLNGDTLIRLCRAGGLSVDAMLEAKLTSSGRCASCGAMRRAS
jgi:hypothetical protein